jgi:hypothetical protein
MYNFYDDDNYGFIKDIEYVKGMYEAQVHKVKQEEYMKDLLFADYVRKVKNHISRYDLIEKVFLEAHNQIGKKKKKEREQLTTIEEFVRDDFLNNDKSFKITNIISGGYDSYYWQVQFEGYGQKFAIIIPNMNRINVNNIKSAYDGMFVFEIQESEYCWSVKKTSYKIEDVAKYIKEYFQLDKVNEDDY